MHKTILVTGAAGFIGSHLVEALVSRGYAVRAFAHYNSSSHLHNLERVADEVMRSVELIHGDITDGYSVGRAVEGCDAVCHLAALVGIPYSYSAPASYVQTNVIGTLNVLEACRRIAVDRVVHVSSSEVYGTARYVPIDEAHPLMGQSPYSATKIAADQLVESYWRSFDVPTVTVRPFNTFGPRQSARAIVPTIVSQALSQPVVRLGSLHPVRELNYVHDTARGIVAALEADANGVLGQVVNLGCGDGRSVGQVVEAVGELLGRTLEVETDPERVRPGKSEVLRLVCNAERAKQLMGWEPRTGFTDGLSATVDYIRERLADYTLDYTV